MVIKNYVDSHLLIIRQYLLNSKSTSKTISIAQMFSQASLSCTITQYTLCSKHTIWYKGVTWKFYNHPTHSHDLVVNYFVHITYHPFQGSLMVSTIRLELLWGSAIRRTVCGSPFLNFRGQRGAKGVWRSN